MENGGLALIADYGHMGEEGDTFRAFKHHSQVDPLVSTNRTLFVPVLRIRIRIRRIRMFLGVLDPDPSIIKQK